MTTAYEKDVTTGVVCLNVDNTIELLADKRPTDETAYNWVKARNADGRVCIPGDKTAYQIAVITKGATYVVASGVTNAPTKNTVTPILVRVRQEEPISEPPEPIDERVR